MSLKYNDKYKLYIINFGCNKTESCNCNEKIVQLFNNNTICEMDKLEVVGLDHIDYDTIKDQINKKLQVKCLFISPNRMHVDKDVLDLNVLELLFYTDEIIRLDVKYSQKLNIGDVSFEKLKDLAINASSWRTPHKLPLTTILPFIIKNCPNIQDLELQRVSNKGDESLGFIIKELTKFDKTLKICLLYWGDEIYKEQDEEYIDYIEWIERLDDEQTILIKSLNDKGNIYAIISDICDRNDL